MGTATSHAPPSLREPDIAFMINAYQFETLDAQSPLRAERKRRWLNQSQQSGECHGATLRVRAVLIQIVVARDGLRDVPRPGAPRTIEDVRTEAVIVRTLESTPRNATHWSSRGMAEASGLSASSVQSIWRAFGLQPHRLETFKPSTDPCFVACAPDLFVNGAEAFLALRAGRRSDAPVAAGAVLSP